MAALGQLLQPKIAGAKPEDNLRLPSNDPKRAIPVPWGRCVVAPQLWDSMDFKAVPVKKRIFTGFWFKTIITGFKYHIGLVLGVCYAGRPGGATIRGIIWKDRYVWQHPGSALYIRSVFVNEPTFWGAEKQEGGVLGRFNFYPGQVRNSIPVEPSVYWESQTGLDMPNYKDVCYAEWLGYSESEDSFENGNHPHLGYVGNTGSLEDILFLVERFPAEMALTGPYTIEGGPGETWCNPISALYECFTNSDFGMGVSTSRMDTDTWNAANSTVAGEGRGFAYLWEQQSTIEDMANEILRYVNGVVYSDLSTGKICIVLAREASTAGLDHLNASHFLEPPLLNRPHWSDTKNQVELTYTDRSTVLHETKSVTDLELANYEIQGIVVPAPIQSLGCPTEALALKQAREAVRVLATPLLRLSGRLSRKAYNYTPGTRFVYDDPDNNISDVTMIVNRIKYGTIIDGAITVEAIEDIFDYGEGSYGTANRVTNDLFGEAAEATLTGAIVVPYFFQRDDNDRPLVFAARPNDSCISYDVALDGDIQPDAVTFAPTGVLTQDYDQLTDPTDNGGTLIIEDLIDLDELQAESATAIANDAVNLIYFEATGELAAFQSFTDNLDGTITLENVWRGVLDTPPMAHAAGERVWFISYGLGLQDIPFTTSVSIEVLPEAVQSAISLEDADAFSLSEDNRPERPNPVRFVTLGGSYTNEFQDTGDVVWAWRESNRTTETTVVKQNNATITPEASTTYEIDIYGEDDTVIRNVTGLTSPTYTYTNANELSDTGKSRLEFFITGKIFSKRDGLRSKHSWDRKVFRIDPDSFGRITIAGEDRVSIDGARRTVIL